MAPVWIPPAEERAVGLEFYATDTPGVDARVKSTADDFRVTEVSAHPMPDADGDYTILTVASRDWEQHELSHRLARALGVPSSSLRWAGTKDRRAVAERIVSYRGAPPSGPLEIPGAEVRDVYRARSGLALGHLFGNSFEIRLAVDHASADAAGAALATTQNQLRTIGGCPNLFGPQRFGEVRPVTHDVGRQLVRGDVAGAVETYLTALPDTSDSLGVEARRSFAEHRDPARARREFPPHFRFERQMLEHLARGQSAARALRALSRELRLLFVHAYQSLLFNRWISRRRAAGLSMVDPVPGDHVLRVGRDGTLRATDAIPVDASNLDEVLDTVRRGGARLAGPLVGFATPTSAGAPGELLETLLQSERIDRKLFETPSTPELASAGSWRPVWLPMPLVHRSEECRGPNGAEDEHGFWLKFALPKGSYATILLREFLKTRARAAE
jgi:tRNA pseudouridine13 synthase